MEDFLIRRGSWNQCPLNTEERLHFFINHNITCGGSGGVHLDHTRISRRWIATELILLPKARTSGSCKSIHHCLQATPRGNVTFSPAPHPTTWKHSFYKPKAVLSQHDQLWAPSSQQCQRLWDWNTRFYKADLGRDPRASLQSQTRCCFPSIASHFLFILAFSSTKINKYFSYLLLFKAIYPFLLLYRLVF